MSDDQDKLKLSLEPPKLFGRKKKSDATGTGKTTSPAPADEPTAEIADAPAEEPVPDPVEPEPVEPEPIEVEPEPAKPQPAKATKTEKTVKTGKATTAKKGGASTPAARSAAPAPVAPVTPEAEPVGTPAETVPAAVPAKPAAKTAAKTPAKSAAKTPAKSAAKAPAARTPVPTAGATEVVAEKPGRPRAKLAPDIEPEPLTRIDQEDAEIAAQADEPPLLPLYPAAAVTGAVIGASMVGLIWLSLRGCEAVRGTSSCSGGPGFLLLVATFVVCVLLGSALLKVFSIPDPGSSSFLAVGLIAVAALLFLIEVLDHWSMLIVIPVIGVAAYLTSVWVTKTFVEEGDTG